MTTLTDDWRGFLDEHGAALLLFARQHVDSLADAEDALQDAFVRFWRTRDRIRDALPYLYCCVRTAALDLRRSAGRRHERESYVAHSVDEAWFDSTIADTDRRKAIQQALAELPIQQREAVVMRIWGGATFPQIGEALGVSSKTASTRYGQAVDSLSSLLSEDLVQ